MARSERAVDWIGWIGFGNCTEIGIVVHLTFDLDISLSQSIGQKHKGIG